MSNSESPEWLQAHRQKSASEKPAATEPASKAGNPGWRKGMSSPNPSGRPKGIVDRRSKLAQSMLDDAQGIIDAMVAQALEGDAQAAGLILSRVLPGLRAQSERVEFDFNATAPVSEQVESVLQAISEGKVAADVGKQIIEAIGSLGAIRAMDTLEARLTALEKRA